MRRTLVVLALAVLAAVAVDAIGDLTQNRPDVVVPGSRSEITLSVAARGRHPSPQFAAESLWGACRGIVANRLAPPGVVEVAPGRVLLVTSPALGDHAWRRLQGCLEDATLDLVRAHVVSKTDRPPG